MDAETLRDATVHSAATESRQRSVLQLMKRALTLCARQIDRQLEPQELTNVQWVPLLKLYMGNASTVGELARECEQDTGCMTRILDRLEAKGLCRRDRSGKDRRTVNIDLTERGRQVAKAIPEVLESVQDAQLADFSPEEIELLGQFLQRMIDNVRRYGLRPRPATG